MRLTRRLIFVSAGYILCFCQIIILAILLCDTYRFTSLNLSLFEAFNFFLDFPVVNPKILLIVTQSIMLPLFIILLKFQLKDFLNKNISEAPFFLRSITFALQLMTVIYALLFYPLIPYMERLSGGKNLGGKTEFVFYSIFDEFLIWFNIAFLVGIVIVAFISPFLDITNTASDFKNALRNFNFWLHFAYPEGDFHPTHRRTLNFNSAGVAPEIKGITKKSVKKI